VPICPIPTRRWVASRKAAVVRAVDHGLITEAEARETWDLSERNWQAWRGGRDATAWPRSGPRRCSATAIQGCARILRNPSYSPKIGSQNPPETFL
jgi:hypothetical protein